MSLHILLSFGIAIVVLHLFAAILHLQLLICMGGFAVPFQHKILVFTS